jgi:hypothetical protein
VIGLESAVMPIHSRSAALKVQAEQRSSADRRVPVGSLPAQRHVPVPKLRRPNPEPMGFGLSGSRARSQSVRGAIEPARGRIAAVTLRLEF